MPRGLRKDCNNIVGGWFKQCGCPNYVILKVVSNGFLVGSWSLWGYDVSKYQIGHEQEHPNSFGSDKEHITQSTLCCKAMADNQEQSSNIDSTVNAVLEKPSELPAPAHVEDASEHVPPHLHRHGSENVPPHPHRLFHRQRTLHEIFGGRKTADVILWKKWTISSAILVGSTVTWVLFEWSGYRPLSLMANVLLFLVAILFIWAKAAAILNRPPPPLPGLELSEEMVNSTAESVRLRINHTLAAAHDIALGKNFSLFAKAVVCLWLISIVSSWFDLITLVYIIVLTVITIPALYNEYGDHIDRHALILEQHYKKFDESVIRRILYFFSRERSIELKEKKTM